MQPIYWLALACGGACGAVLRYFIINQLQNSPSFIATLFVNIFGSFCIGIFFAVLQNVPLSPLWRLAIQTGLLGGFTTFSAFSLEILQLLQIERYYFAILYIFSSIFFGILSAWIGWLLVQKIF